MAKLAPQSVMNHAAGKVGDLVFRQHLGKTVAQLRPRKSRKKESPLQKQGRGHFREAAKYSAKILADPLQRKVYQQLGRERGQPPNALLISNFLTPPTVDLIETSGYRGQPGGLVKVVATDDIEVVSVAVSIRDAEGELVETGPAVKDHGVWIYTATTPAPAGQVLMVHATATDRPGHQATQSVPVASRR